MQRAGRSAAADGRRGGRARAALRSIGLGLSMLVAGAGGATDLELRAAPGAASEAEIAEFFARAAALEKSAFESDDPVQARAQLLEAAPLFERVGLEEARRTQGHWRAARATWLAGELLPLDQTDAKMAAFERALILADRGLAANPDCAECMLWKFIAMGRLRTTAGMWEGIRQVGEMAELLDRAIALKPTHRDSEDNSTLGNLHYSSAIFYRIVPDWFWIRWVLGVKGDKERALWHSRQALALHPSRVDYQIEVGTQLLCLGSVNEDPERTRQGLEVMRTAVARNVDGADFEREVMFARIMIEEPHRACGYTGDKLMEMDPEAARKAVR